MLFARTVSTLGTLKFAAHQIGLNISGLSFAPSMAFGVASTTLVGQSLGAEKEEQAESYARIVHKIALVVAILNALLFILFSYPMARMYTSDPAVAAAAGMVLKILALALPGQSTQFSLAGALRGLVTPCILCTLRRWDLSFRVVVAYIFVRILPLNFLVGACRFCYGPVYPFDCALLPFPVGKMEIGRLRVVKEE